MNPRESENESGSDLFARLYTQSISATNSPTQLQTSISHFQFPNNPLISQLENILMINKTLNIDYKLFPSGISNREIVEISGKVGVGKSELVMHLISRCLLPARWNIQQANSCGDNMNSGIRIPFSPQIIDLREK